MVFEEAFVSINGETSSFYHPIILLIVPRKWFIFGLFDPFY